MPKPDEKVKKTPAQTKTIETPANSGEALENALARVAELESRGANRAEQEEVASRAIKDKEDGMEREIRSGQKSSALGFFGIIASFILYGISVVSETSWAAIAAMVIGCLFGIPCWWLTANSYKNKSRIVRWTPIVTSLLSLLG